MLTDVIEYNSDFPAGFTRQIESNLIKRFYAPSKDLVYVVHEIYFDDLWPAKYKVLVDHNKLFTLWDVNTKKTSFYIKPCHHPVMIEVKYASPAHIYDNSTYIQSYFSNMSLKEFTKLHGSEKYVVEDKPIENRWDILDIRKK